MPKKPTWEKALSKKASMSVKDFMAQVESRAAAMPVEALRDVITQLARQASPVSRVDFLAHLALPPENPPSALPDEDLLVEIHELTEKVESGELCEGFGWDPEIRDERDFGDESWAEEVDNFLSRTKDALMSGYYALAQQAYDEIFDILDMGEEPEHLPGPPDPEELLNADMDEVRAQYLRAVYLATPGPERPSAIMHALTRFKYHIGPEFNLQLMRNAGEGELPEFLDFLRDWITYLGQPGKDHRQFLLREATLLAGGTPAIADLTRQHGDRHPRAYIEWIASLEKAGDVQGVNAAAMEALANLPEDCTIRSEAGAQLARAGVTTGDLGVQLTGWRAAFHSDPDLGSGLRLLEVATKLGIRDAELTSAIARVRDLLGRQKTGQVRTMVGEEGARQASGSRRLLGQLQVLAGLYKEALESCAREKPLGWSSGLILKAFVVPYFLLALFMGDAKRVSPQLNKIWLEALEGVNWKVEVPTERSNISRVRDAFGQAMQETPILQEDATFFLEWCTREVGARVDAIVGGQHRGSYSKAAVLLGALAEVLASRGQADQAEAIYEKYRQKYSRHRSFQQALCIGAGRPK